jgi:multimeric flavodoxin WrbA
VSSGDEGAGDEWPHIGERVLAAEVLLFGTPIWIGHPCSIAQRVIERMDAWLFSYDELGRKKVYGRVAGVAITGNEDGGHHVFAECAQALNDVGFVLPPESRVYWTGWTDESPGPNYATSGRGHKSVEYMGQHMARNLVVFAHAMRELTARIEPLESDKEAAAHPEEGLARAKKLHES